MSTNADKLVRFHDGSWVRPSAVTCVAVEARDVSPADGTVSWRVNVYLAALRLSFEAGSFDAARDLCDKIGRTLADAEDDQEEDA